MFVPAVAVALSRRILWSAVVACAATSLAQNPPASQVVIPNPTPRPPDLKQEYGNESTDQTRQGTLSIQNQIHAREIWLESNQILLLAQQLLQEIPTGKKPTSLIANAVKAGAIAKLAKDVQVKMKAH